MRCQKLLRGLAVILLLVLMVVVLLPARPSNAPLTPRLNAPAGPGPTRPSSLSIDAAVPVSGVVTGEAMMGVSPALRDLVIPYQEPATIIREMPEREGDGEAGLAKDIHRPQIQDPAVQSQFGVSANAPVPLAPAPDLSFEGVYNIDGFYPPDTNGDVGPNHYVQMVNMRLQVYDKSGKPLLANPIRTDKIWTNLGGPCATRFDGDPIVLYDPMADRWLVSQFTSDSPYGECVAISQTPDPTGAYYLYFFQLSTTVFYDYPHFGVWPDGYYMSANKFDNTFTGASAIVLDRARMLQGLSATYQEFQVSAESYGALLPADLDGATPPPAGAAEYFGEIGSTALHFWRFHVDWTTPANSTFTGPATLSVAAYNQLCPNTANCVSQSGTTQKLDGLGDRLMHRLAYRNFGSYEAMVVSHAVNAAASGRQAAVRWYEIRNTGGTLSINQQGTYAPDATERWMSSIAMDRNGNMLLGYSASSSSLFPGIRYTGRLATDPLNLMPQGESVLITGTGAQTGSAARWGDYSMMAVDPSDDCTFWFTTEYIQTTGKASWKTRIGSFIFEECTPVSAGDLSGTVRNAADSNPITAANVAAVDSRGRSHAALTDDSGRYQITHHLIGTYTVTASADGYYPDVAIGVNVTTDVTTTQNFTLTALPQADLSLIKTASASVLTPSGSLAYTLTVTNNGPDTITGTVTITDDLPAGYTLDTTTGTGWSCSDTPTIVCTRAGLDAGASASVNITGAAPAIIGPIVNIATTDANVFDPSPVNNTAQITTNISNGEPTYGVELTPATAGQMGLAGTVVTYTLNVTNTGNAIDTFTVTVSGNGFATNAPASVGPLAAGSSTTINVGVTIPPGAAGMLDTANVTLTSQGDGHTSISASLTTTVRFSVYLPLVLNQP